MRITPMQSVMKTVGLLVALVFACLILGAGAEPIPSEAEIAEREKAERELVEREVEALEKTWREQFAPEKTPQGKTKQAPVEPEKLVLSMADRAYLNAYSPIRLCIDPHWMPYEAWDEKAGYIGIAAEFIAVFGKMLDVEFEVKVTQSWPESLELTRRGVCDVLSFINLTPDRKKWLLFTDPYLIAPSALATRKSVRGIRNLKSLRGKKVAVVEDYVYEEYLRDHYPKVIVRRVASTDDGLRKTADGEVAAMIESLFILRYKIRVLGLDNLKVSGRTKFINAYRFGIRKELPKLQRLLNKAIIKLDPGIKHQILSKWAAEPYK